MIQLRQALDTRIGYLVHDIPRLFRNFDLPPSNKIETHDFHHLSIQLSLGQPHRKYFSMLLYERSTLSFPLSILFYFSVTITSSPPLPLHLSSKSPISLLFLNTICSITAGQSSIYLRSSETLSNCALFCCCLFLSIVCPHFFATCNPLLFLFLINFSASVSRPAASLKSLQDFAFSSSTPT